jgi:hypothetical protein
LQLLRAVWRRAPRSDKLSRPVVPSRDFTPQPETGPYVVMGHLRHRDRIVTIKSGEQGTVYSVQNADGKILFENLTAAQLKSQAARNS